MAVRKRFPGEGLQGPGGPITTMPRPSRTSQVYQTLSSPGGAAVPRIGAGAAPGGAPAMAKTWNAGDDPGYQRVASQVEAQRAQDAAQRRQNIQQALISFGMVPGQFSDQYGDIDANTRGMIDKNTNTGISQYARLLDSKQEAKTALLNRLGAKGLFRSGAKGKGLRRGQLDFDRSLADSMAALMQNLGNFSGGYAANELARQQALQNAMAAAYQNYVPPSTSSGSFDRFASGGMYTTPSIRNSMFGGRYNSSPLASSSDRNRALGL